jgi:hypothetical protein
MRVVLLLGAGATLSDVATRPRKYRPPLDKGFFRLAKQSHPALADDVASYMRQVYGASIYDPEEDSLEAVMGQIYTDLFSPALAAKAKTGFRGLLQLFNRRLAETTNDIDATSKRWVYRILAHYLGPCRVDPEDLAIVTFNQDIQVEKCLSLMSETNRWQKIADRLFNFPWLYRIGAHRVTSPSGRTSKIALFAETPEIAGAVRVLKLHGSLNWYSNHTSAEPSPDAMFRPQRHLSITRRRIIAPSMSYTGGKRRTYTLPVVIPPVTHKSAVLHQAMQTVWSEAENALRAADELVVFGYSCPQLDFESSNQLKRALHGRDTRVSVIDPNGAIAARYIELLAPQRLSYFPSASAFLADR